MTLGEAIRHYRKKKGISQRHLDRDCGFFEVCRIQRLENGPGLPKLGTVDAVAKGLGIPTWHLVKMWETGEEEPQS